MCRYGRFRRMLDYRRLCDDMSIKNCLTGDYTRDFIQSFVDDNAGVVVDRQTGQVVCGGFAVRDRTGGWGGGGARTEAASAMAVQAGGCYVILASKSICGSVEHPPPAGAKLRVFDCKNQPQEVPVVAAAPHDQTTFEYWLQPLEFGADLAAHNEHFVDGTRQWIFQDIDDWRRNLTGLRCRALLAGPGFGKSAIVAQVWKRTGDRALALHLCQHNNSAKRDPKRLVTSLAYQIAQVLPHFRAALERVSESETVARAVDARDDARQLAECLLLQPLNECAPETEGGRYLLVIDALDEAEHASKNSLLELIARDFHKLPPWMAVLVTARPELDVRRTLAPLRPTVLDAATYHPECDADVRIYLRAILKSSVDARRIEASVETVATKSGGLFLYLHYIRESLES